MNLDLLTAKPPSWFFRRVLSERQLVIFLIAVWVVATVQSCAVSLHEGDYDFADEKGTYITYPELAGARMKLAAFRDHVFGYWLGLHVLVLFVVVKLRSWISLPLAIILPMLWIFLIVGRFTP